MTPKVLDSGELQFSVEARILRELGERLVRRPETALIELIKNAYDADATECQVKFTDAGELHVVDDGQGMSLLEFKNGWMRIGTAAKAATSTSRKFRRQITGEKGIGRFSVRFLGEHLRLTSIAYDPQHGRMTQLVASFDWPSYDASEDIGKILVPYEVTEAPPETSTGTTLEISRIRPAAKDVDLKKIRTASIGLVSPLRSLIVAKNDATDDDDPGFRLVLGDGEDAESEDIAASLLDAYTLRATLTVRKTKVQVRVFTPDKSAPYFEVTDTVTSRCGNVDADIRFFPRRSGAFKGLGVDGRVAYTWVRENSGVAVFDRDFRVSPYGEPQDDWLGLTADAARNARTPRSTLAKKHFPMSESVRTSTADNWMLRLPQAAQVIGVVKVKGSRSAGALAPKAPEGLVAAADREGFVANDAFADLVDHVRGAVEAIAMVDRELQKAREDAERRRRLEALQDQAAAAARDIEANPNIPAADKKRLVTAVASMAAQAQEHERAAQERVKQLEVMSLLGVIAGFMTHEFGVALDELDKAHRLLEELTKAAPKVKDNLARLDAARDRLKEFAEYSTAYIKGSRATPENPYPALPRLRLVRKTFGQYADERAVSVDIEVGREVPAPQVPTALYDGIILNLLTNALKSVTALVDPSAERRIAFRAWNDRGIHHLECVDTGLGIPTVLRERIFDPLFTTTSTRNDPLGSGMGLGLALVRASVEAFGGRVRVIDPPAGFATCVQVRLPLQPQE